MNADNHIPAQFVMMTKYQIMILKLLDTNADIVSTNMMFIVKIVLIVNVY